ncbi:homeobox-leucine zipper protein HDG11-like [Camellia sinensis]|uniref:homeobox-leucine zipper protein HDG11-like n=1 Tax=Camellia sinensis TaxID=4442 RepID=UPI00103667EF|nr:homeobox-leucine zipper protein HDG11-like [Camellia sinensis]
MMDFGYGSNNGTGSGDEQEAGSSSRKNKKHYYRHTAYQTQQLEAFFKECQHPDDNQRRQLSRELGLESKQIKFWFQNKRTQTKAQNERADNNALKVENEKIQCENLAIREALKNVTCPNCGGPPFGEEERQLNVQKLKMQNSHLKQEYERMSHFIANILGKPVAQIQSLCSMDFQSQTDILGFSASQGLLGGSSSNSTDQLQHQFQQLDDHIGNSNNNNNSTMQQQMQYPLMNDYGNNKFEMEKMAMIETAVSAMGELMRLLRVNEPVWIKSSSPVDHDGDSRRSSYLLHRDSYNKLFPRSNHFKSSTARMESSKDSGVVPMSAVHLLNMFLDSNKWMDLFPTIVTKARTIEVVDTRMLGDQAGSLQLMYEQMHILSPLVAPREFYFLRYCREVEASVWMMVDVSYEYDCSKLSKDLDPRGSPPRSWRLPSGCMLQDKPNGCCEVTWVEHVEVDDKSQTHRLYRDLVCGGLAYGAQRWIATLHRMSERLAYSLGAALSRHELGGAKELAVAVDDDLSSATSDGVAMSSSAVELQVGGVLEFGGELLAMVFSGGVASGVQQHRRCVALGVQQLRCGSWCGEYVVFRRVVGSREGVGVGRRVGVGGVGLE